MPTISYETISNLSRSNMEDYDVAALSDEYIELMQGDWMHTIAANPRVRKMFSSFTISDEEKAITFEMKISVDDSYDSEFVTSLFASGMVVTWLTPIVNSKKNVSQMYGGKEEKFYSQAGHLTAIRELLKDNDVKFKCLIRDYNSYFNSYLKGE